MANKNTGRLKHIASDGLKQNKPIGSQLLIIYRPLYKPASPIL
ncbi:hypothetical protein [Neisseria sp. HMSC065C04]|nr:hypothetical protein [Neisseria sp. HMSC065C04]